MSKKKTPGKHEVGGTPPKKQTAREPPQKKAKKKRTPFLKRLLFGEDKPDLSILEAGATTIMDILSPTAVDTTGRDTIVVDGIFHTY